MLTKLPRSRGELIGNSLGVPRMPRILIVDSHGIYRKGLRFALQICISSSEIVESESLKAARNEFDPDGILDLVLVDVDTADASLEMLRPLRDSHPGTRLAAMSATLERTFILRCLESGLFGFISKCQSDEEICSAVKDILSGRIYVPAMISQSSGANGFTDSGGDRRVAPPPVAPDVHPERLTPRQRDILPLLAKGMSNKEIARALKIAEGTTKIHASSLLRVLGVRNRTEAAVVARDHFLPSKNIASQPADAGLRAVPRRR